MATLGLSKMSNEASTEDTLTTSDNKGYPSSSKKGKKKKGFSSLQNRTVALRSCLMMSLAAAIAICSTLAYTQLRSTEENVGIQTYRSIALSATNGAKAITHRKVQGSDAMMTLMSDKAPDAADWPFISFDGYIPISQKIADLSASATQGLIVMVDPADARRWENHTKEVYEAQGRPEGAGYSDFGFGIWKPDKNESKAYDDGRLPDVTGETNWGGRSEKMVVLFMHNQPGAGSLNYNIYADANRGIYIDSVYDCVKANKDASKSPPCTVVTDMLELKLKPGPAGAMFQPIYPQNDPNTVVGFVGTSIHWEDVLTNVVPDYVNGLICVVSTDTSAFTFKIRNGNPVLVGAGDLHDRAYTSFGKSVILNDFETSTAISAVYTLTVYPTNEIFDAFSTRSPTTVALGFAGVIAGVACLFFGYDYLVRREAKQRNTILEMKRRFVRFISHEIRTPLNTVCMGLELLQSELKAPNRKWADLSSTGQVADLSSTGQVADVSSTGQVADEDIGFWLNVTEEINENAHVAVEILNDLLNYDKLETGTLELENEPVLIWDLIEKTFNQFGIQAVNRKIDFKLEMERPSGDFVPDLEIGPHSFDPYNVIGDRIRLSEVIRNVLSNALKFTPEDGTILVTATYLPNGLPNAKDTAVDGEEGALRERAGSIQLCVKDSGVGLSIEQLSLLFSEGVQFDANRLQHGGGSGLGLNIAKGLVEQHHGLIYAESKGLGDGTTFKVELPLYSFLKDDLERFVDNSSTGHTASDADSSHEFTLGDAEEVKPVARRVLVAEDSASSRKMFVRLLERAGNNCVPPAANGKEAVEMIKEDLLAASVDPDHVPIYCILMDYEMPLINGPDATKLIRALGYKGIILGITGNVLSEDIEYFKEHGADEVMSKPVSLKVIEKYWKGHHHQNAD